MTTASVIGREFSFAQLDLLIEELSEDALLEALDEADEAHVVEEVEGEIGTYRFTHALIQQTLASELSTTRRARIHGRKAEIMEELYGDNIEAHAEELAHHYNEASAMIGSEKMVYYSLMAGERALATYAWEDAIVYFGQALGVREGQLVDKETGDILFGLGQAKAATVPRTDAQEVWDIFSRAFDCYVESGNIQQALDVAGYRFPFGPYIKGQVQVTKRAMDLAPHDSPQIGSLFYQHGLALYYELGDYDKAQETLNQAIEIAKREKDTALEVKILSSASVIDIWERRIGDSTQKNIRILELLPNVEMPFAETLAKSEIANHALIAGDLDKARQYAFESIAAADGSYNYHHMTAEYFFNATLARIHGDWQGVRDFTDKALDVSRNEAFGLCVRALLHHELGDPKEGNALIQQLMDTVPINVPEARYERQVVAQVISLIAQNTGTASHIDTAQRSVEMILSLSPIRPSEEVAARASLGLIAAYKPDADLAFEQYKFLKSETYKMTTQCLITLDRTLGLLAHTMGHLDAAARHFEDALAFCGNAGYRPEVAWTCYDYAALLQVQGEYEKALGLLDEALAISTELGMSPLLKKVMTLKENSESKSIASPKYPAGLTEREVKVLQLLAQGKTNREFAHELHLSARTVQRHISNLYVKINVRNRVEATAFALNESSITPQPSPSN